MHDHLSWGRFWAMRFQMVLFVFHWAHLLYLGGLLLLVAIAMIPSLRAYYKRKEINKADKALFEDKDED